MLRSRSNVTFFSTQGQVTLRSIVRSGWIKKKGFPVFPQTCRKNIGSVGRIFLLLVVDFLSNFYLLEKYQKCLLGLNFINCTKKKIQIMKLRASRKLKDRIASNCFVILTFFLSCLSNFLKNVRVGRYENLSFFWKAIKIAGSAQKTRVSRVSGNTGILFRPNSSEQGYRNFEIQIGPLDRWNIRTCVQQSQIVTKTDDSSFSSKSVSEIDYFSNTL